MGVGCGADACLQPSLTHPGTPGRAGPSCLSAAPSPPRHGPGGEAAAPGLAHVRAPAGPAFPLCFLLLERSSTCCACPETSLPDGPSSPHVGVAPADPGGSLRPWLPPPSPSASPESALFSEALRPHMVRWRGPVPTPDWGLSSASGGVPGAVPSTPAGLHTGSAGGPWLRAGASGSCLPPPPASFLGGLAELGCWELWGPPTWARGGGGVVTAGPGRDPGSQDGRTGPGGGAVPDAVPGGRGRCPLAAPAGTGALREHLGCGGGPVRGGPLRAGGHRDRH